MTRRLTDAYGLTGWGTILSLLLAAVVVIVAALLVFLAWLVPVPPVALARDASLVLAGVVTVVTMLLFSSHIYLHYELVKRGLIR